MQMNFPAKRGVRLTRLRRNVMNGQQFAAKSHDQSVLKGRQLPKPGRSINLAEGKFDSSWKIPLVKPGGPALRSFDFFDVCFGYGRLFCTICHTGNDTCLTKPGRMPPHTFGGFAQPS